MFRKLLCLIGWHGKAIGLFELRGYAVGSKISPRHLRYKSYMGCPHCKKEERK